MDIERLPVKYMYKLFLKYFPLKYQFELIIIFST